MESIHDKIKKQVAEEVQRKIDAERVCSSCIVYSKQVDAFQILINRKDAEIAELKEELGRFHASMIAGRLNP